MRASAPALSRDLDDLDASLAVLGPASSAGRVICPQSQRGRVLRHTLFETCRSRLDSYLVADTGALGFVHHNAQNGLGTSDDAFGFADVFRLTVAARNHQQDAIKLLAHADGSVAA